MNEVITKLIMSTMKKAAKAEMLEQLSEVGISEDMTLIEAIKAIGNLKMSYIIDIAVDSQVDKELNLDHDEDFATEEELRKINEELKNSRNFS